MVNEEVASSIECVRATMMVDCHAASARALTLFMAWQTLNTGSLAWATAAAVAYLYMVRP